MTVSPSCLRHLLTHSAHLWEADREWYESLLRELESVPEAAQTVVMSVDGVMTLVRASRSAPSVVDGQNHAQNGFQGSEAVSKEEALSKKEGKVSADKTAPKTVSYRELGCATVALYDAEGER